MYDRLLNKRKSSVKQTVQTVKQTRELLQHQAQRVEVTRESLRHTHVFVKQILLRHPDC